MVLRLYNSGPKVNKKGTNVLFLMASMKKNMVQMAKVCVDAVKGDSVKLADLVNNSDCNGEEPRI